MDEPDFFTPKTIPIHKKKFLKSKNTYETSTLDDIVLEIKPEKNYVPIQTEDTIKMTHIDDKDDTKDTIDTSVAVDTKDALVTVDVANERYVYLNSLYNNMTNVENMRSKNQEEIKTLNNDFKQELNTFKKNYGSMKIYDSEISKFDESILRGQHRNLTLELFDEPSNFNKQILAKSLPELNIITDISMIVKSGSSTSFIFKAKYLGKLCYIKAFFISENNLIYEQKIYQYIKTRNERIKPFFEEYFVKVYDTIKVGCRDFYDFLNLRKVKIVDQFYSSPWNTNEQLRSGLSRNIYIYLIITEDIGGISYKEFYENNYGNENLITNTLFDIIYGIYLMNDKLKIFHNDNHFANILIKTDIPQNESKYQINKIEYTKTKNFRLCFYDFDLSFLSGEPNPYLYSDWLAQNKRSAKDVWTLLNALIGCTYYSKIIPQKNKEYILNTILDDYIFDKDFWSKKSNRVAYEQFNYISKFVAQILNYSKLHGDNLKKVFTDHIHDGQFWNAYCVDNVQEPCVIPDEPFLYAREVINRLMEDEDISKLLNFTTVDPFYKKYLKYKSKYLKLKSRNLKSPND